MALRISPATGSAAIGVLAVKLLRNCSAPLRRFA
jgi:hypothetical protein